MEVPSFSRKPDFDTATMVATVYEWHGTDALATRWKHEELPGRIKCSHRHRFLPGGQRTVPVMIEDIVLQELPLELEQPERLPRRR